MRVSNQEKGLDRARPFPPWTTVWTIDRAIDSILPMLTCQSYVSHNTKMARLKMLACGYAAMEIELELRKSTRVLQLCQAIRHCGYFAPATAGYRVKSGEALSTVEAETLI